MHRLSPIILLLGLTFGLQAQSPHGADFRMDCAACHTADSWEIPASAWDFGEPGKPKVSKTTGWVIAADTLRFNHYNTSFPLEGAHTIVDCRSCHATLVFSEAQTDCISCHTDMHSQTVGSDCARCHTTDNWMVDNITELHQENGFPLLGVHASLSCNECHISESELKFERIGNDCINCHLDDYNATTNPNHQEANFSTDCTECHRVDGSDWTSEEVNHDFFPLTKGHEITDCAKCHTGGEYSNTPTDCVACHLADYNNALNPNHLGAGFSMDCINCHTTDVGWTPADYAEHDADYFPIYSGAHQGEWSECIECHTDPSNFSEFTCVTCHTNPETDDQHNGVNGYSYNSPACLACHPNGSSTDNFDHNLTGFPLTGAHTTVDCIACHANGYAGTPTECAACHTPDFNQTTNPNHVALGLPTDCATCHTTEPGWMPATFDIHDDFYVLNGAHAAISNDCAACHNGDYNNTPNTCVGCHTEDFNQTTDPDHEAAQFPVDCESCHTETAWVPSTFDHNNFYPFTGAHIPIANDCVACHNGDYTNTPNTCDGCHIQDYEQTVNPNHTVLNLPTNCESCHTTEPDWMPATFDIHDDFYVLNGAHAAIANDCAACHNGDYNNTPNTCFGCHAEDYNNTTDPNHTALQFSTDCQSCHSESEWIPATFDHDAQHFPIYSGKHEGEWSECIDCHTNPGNYAEFTCITCHTNPETDDEHNGVNGYVYNSSACLACHPTGDADIIFDHNQTAFPLTGAHISTDCIDCHANGYVGTPTECAACHTPDFNQTTNPNHVALGLPTDCQNCHTTEPGWMPATFAIHDDFYVLNGAHAAISNDCASCHNGDYNNTPNTCVGCHTEDFNQTTDPDHEASQFPVDCESCHTETAWVPSTFDHNNFYPFTGAHIPIANDCVACHNGDYTNTPNTCDGCHIQDYEQTVNPNHTVLNLPTNCESCHTTEPDWMPATFNIHDDFYVLNGAHAAIANDCAACHNGDYNNTPNTCFGCHAVDYNNTTNPNHTALQFSTDCQSCHTESEWVPSTFDHDGQYFPIYSGKHEGEWSECIDCHTNPANYAEFTCTNCHTNPETDDQHNGVNGYVYNSSACLACHPTGDGDIIFDHNETAFPLTGAHIATDCIACHAGGYPGTPTECVACHTPDFNQATNPNHVALGLPTDCATCHSTEPGWMPATFDIHDDFYVLNGAHALIANDCAACHNGNYNNTPNTCFGCHEVDYNQTTNPDHEAAQFPTDCESCHSESEWIPSTFDHDNFYPLTGAHVAIENDCVACHENGYQNTPNTCDGCHMADYNESTNPNHVALGLPTTCESCHSTEPDWMPATFDIHDDYYVLNGAHALIANDCAVCHNGNYNNTPNTCFGCHEVDYNQTTNPDHEAAQFPTDCQSCHTEDAWVPSTFDHNSIYPLNGAHELIANDCIACHSNGYPNTPNTCFGCHEVDYNQTTNPDHEAAQFPTDCESCHSENAWIPSTFDHDNFYPLTGAHLIIENDCIACHENGYQNTPNTCEGCHITDFNQSTNPNHVALGLPTDCADCHTTEPDWMPATFDIHNNYYQLNGAHSLIANDCAACHNGNYNNTPNTCFGCHEVDYNQTTNPDHEAAQFPTDCESCHSESAWIPSTFDHDNFYPLTGAHLIIENDCIACHENGYQNTPNTCEGCHMTDYNQSTNPNHVSLGLPTDCADCHTTEPDWMPATFDIHNNYYQLNGAHALIANDCAACHNGNYNNTPNTCFGCHEVDYNQTTNPDHEAAQFPTDCESCHSESAWIPSTFDHDNFYPLTGVHLIIENDCIACHENGYQNTPNTCEGCHMTDYNQSTNPNHVSLGIPTDCADCHTTEPDWMPATFDIHNNYYQLNGAHALIANDCAACHNGNYNNTPNTCFGCHEVDYNQTTNPDHEQAQFPTDCESCHSESAWIPSTFDHDNFYPLTGAHLIIENDCIACHENGYQNTPNTCEGCHMTDYNQSTNPNHVSLGIPTDCADCHTTEPDWMPATFDIHNNYYQLNGAHALIANDCAACHNGNYNNTPNTCFGCHEDDYNATNNPDHQSAGFPTTCDDCHSENAWVPSTFDHDDMYFPIYSGKHEGEWDACIDCHTVPNNYTLFACIECHPHDDQQQTDEDHDEVTGYEYSSPACYACHPDGED